MPTNIVVDTEKTRDPMGRDPLVAWVMNNVEMWERHREANYDERFREYNRIYRGIWAEEDKTRSSENSRLISPATQQAVEATVAELEEATFGKGMWFDVSDDVLDQDKTDMAQYRDVLREDLELAGVPAEVARTYLNGALFGTGIAKVLVSVERYPKVVETVDQATGQKTVDIQFVDRVIVRLEPINPLEFVIDPSARFVEEALGCAHVINKPKHSIIAKQKSGVYADVPLGAFPTTKLVKEAADTTMSMDTDGLTRIVEYHGKVPRELLPLSVEDGEEVVELFPSDDNREVMADETDMVEAIVTIANDNVLLRAVENPFMFQDRSVISYQHDTVNDSFWGRGVVEKGYNAQKALDAELRARIDAMAFASHPMVAADATRLPRGADYKVRPGKIWLTMGNPSETFMPFSLNNVNNATFHQSGDLERMVQMGTGAMDSATPVAQAPRNQTASGMSMMQSQFIKRNKRSMQNIERHFLSKLIEKAAWRYMQFYEERYPMKDPNFQVHASMGIVAREFEQNQLTQLLSIVPPDSPVFGVILKGIFGNSSLTNKSELLAALEQQLAPNPAEQQAAQAQIQQMQLELQKLLAEIEKIKSESYRNTADAQAKLAEIGIRQDKNFIEAKKVDKVNSSREGK